MDEVMQIQTQRYEGMNAELENKLEAREKQVEQFKEQVEKEKRKNRDKEEELRGKISSKFLILLIQ